MTQVNSEKTVWGGWGASAVLSPPPCHLEDVMSEELAKQLHESENVRYVVCTSIFVYSQEFSKVQMQ